MKRALLLVLASTSFALVAAACSSSDDGSPNAPGADAGSDAVVVGETSVPPTDDGGLPDASPPPADAATCTPGSNDIASRLACIPGMTVVEVVDPPDAGTPRVPAGYRRFDMTYVQPVDHDHPDGAHFGQRLSLLHKAETAPMVLASSGYGLSTGRSEITRLFATNQLQVEHRYFTPSIPQPTVWDKLTIQQSAADYHAIVTALKPIYGAHWLNTGASKGGMTSVYHRRFYPNDLDATVAYVAPNVYGTDDQRFVTFLANVGGATYADCRSKIVELQKAVLTRRDELEPKMVGTYDELGGPDVAIEHAVLEMPFTFWQYTDPTNPQEGCAAIPASNAPADALFSYFSGVTQLENYGDDGFAYFSPYYYQAATQLGAPGVDDAPILSLLKHRATYTVNSYAPKGVPITFDPEAMKDVQAWVKTDGKTLMFIYGEYDPWSAGAFDLGAATDSFKYFAPGKNHGSKIATLAPADQTAAMQKLQTWLGVPPVSNLVPVREAADDSLARRPRL